MEIDQFDLLKQNNLTKYESPPGQGTQFVVRKNLKEILDLAIKDSLEFTHNNIQKSRALGVIQNVITICRESVQMSLEKILRCIYKYIQDEDTELVSRVLKISDQLGIYIKPDMYMPIILTHINEEENKQQLRTLCSIMIVLARLLKYCQQQDIIPHLNQLRVIVVEVEQNHSENSEIIQSLFKLTASIIETAQQSIIPYTNQFFGVLVSLQASTLLDNNSKSIVQRVSEKLAYNSGYSSIGDLYANEVYNMLNQYYTTKSYTQWNKYSRERYKFDVIVRQCREGITQYFEIILDIMGYCVNSQLDYEMRIDMLTLLEYILQQTYIHTYIQQQYASVIISKIIIPSLVWRAGKPNTKIRKAAIINLIHILQNNLVNDNELYQLIKEIIPVIKNCLNDDWSPDLRFIACTFLEKFLGQLTNLINDDDIRDIYPALLERLDDSQDVIRIEITKAFQVLFQCKTNISQSTFEYQIKSIFIHLDDPNEDIQLAIYNLLKAAAHRNYHKVLEIAQDSVNKQKYPRKCKELIKEIENMLETQQ